MAPPPPRVEISLPLINTANPSATTLEDLRLLYACRSTGAVTTRTSLINGFDHNPEVHQHAFFSPAHPSQNTTTTTHTATLNTLGYSPHTLSTYLHYIKTISDELPLNNPTSTKGFIISVTGPPSDIAACYKLITSLAPAVNCPNIPHRPPPAYSEEALTTYLEHIARAVGEASDEGLPRIPVGLKTPPYTYATQYHGLIAALEKSAGVGMGMGCVQLVSLLLPTHGSCLVLDDGTTEPLLPGSGVGGMAGAPLHPLALGNVRTIRRMLDERQEKLGHVQVIGVGGVLDAAGYKRMRAVGAEVVGLASGLLLKGVGFFGEIEDGLGGKW
ncbi:dihydroorotate dehydrogenase [Collariella sp. IMI 366227]|nr:dihydroorotate dehydrogenase [Collariella sp. IMI 366227]